MSVAMVLEVLLEWAKAVPVVAKALASIVEGHPDTQKVRDVLPLKSASERVADELKAEGGS